MREDNIKNTKKLVTAYDDLIKKASDIANNLSDWIFDCEYLACDDTDMISACGAEYDDTGTAYGTRFTFPIDWLFLSEDELEKAINERKRLDTIAEREEKKRQAENNARIEEEKERAEYERLRAKFENKERK